MRNLSPVALLLLTLLLTPIGAQAQWPQWQGPDRNGVAVGVAGTVPAAVKLTEAWRTPLDAGVGSVAIDGGAVYVLASDLDNDLLVALSAADGKETWRTPLDATPDDSTDGPGSTPLVAGDRVFALSTSCTLVAVKAGGEVLWKRGLAADYQAAHRGGCATVPLAHEDTVIVHVNGREKGRVVAFRQSDGTTAWEATAEPVIGSSPMLLEVGGEEHLAVQTLNLPQERGQAPTGKLFGLDPESQEIRWSFSTDEHFAFAAPLVLGPGKVLFSTWTDSYLLTVSPPESEEGEATVQTHWRSRDIKANIGLPVRHEGHVYGFGNEELACIELATGKTRWQERTYPGSVILVDGHLILLSEHAGLLRVVEASAAGYQEKARLQLVEPGYPMTAPPAFADGKVYVRTPDALIAVALQ